MNIIWANSIRLAAVILLLPMLLPAEEFSADTASAELNSYFSAELMGGITYNLRDDVFKSQKMHALPSLRLLWKPGHRLNIGIESAYITIRRIEIEKNKNKLSGHMEAIPLLLIFNMKAFHLDFTAGIGTGYVSSTIDVMKEVTTSTNWHYCFLFGMGYSYMFSETFGLGLEGRLLSFTKTDEFVGSAVLKLVYNLAY